MAYRAVRRGLRPGRSLAILIGFVLAFGCGVAPVRLDGAPDPPPTWRYLGVHGRPLAFGGGVCAVRSPHDHDYPPAPRAAFRVTNAGLVDTRPVWAYFDAHPHGGRTCFRDGWHLHLKAPDASLVYDVERAAWRVARASGLGATDRPSAGGAAHARATNG